MSTSLQFLLRRHGMVMLVTVLLAASRFVPFVPDELAQIASFGAFILFLYRLNVEDRLRKTWNHYQALPFTLAERVVARIAVPVVLYVGIHLLSHGVAKERPEFFLNLVKHLLEGAVLVWVSLVARSMFRYLVLAVLGLGAVTFTIWWVDGAVSSFVAFVVFAWSVVILSGRRLRFRTVGVPAGCLGALVAGLFAWKLGWRVAPHEIVVGEPDSSVTEEYSEKETHEFVDDEGHAWEVEQKTTRRRLPDADPETDSNEGDSL